MTPEETLDEKITQLRNAVTFYDKVKASTYNKRTAAGTDHHEWLASAARKVAYHKE